MEQLLFFREKVLVEKFIDNSSRAVVFFGRETNLGIKVVVKQYSGQFLDELIRELRLFTYIENFRFKTHLNKRKSQAPDLAQIFVRGSQHDGLPKILGYRIKEDQGEILMTSGGTSIENWMAKIKNKQQRYQFVTSMLRQLIPGLNLIHSFGYAHGDLKFENICARKS